MSRSRTASWAEVRCPPFFVHDCALVVVAVLVAAWDARVVLAASAVTVSPGDDRPCEAETARWAFYTVKPFIL
jgi:hypothetical protein